MDMGERIREARKQRGLSQEAVAYRVGLEQTELSKIERGRRQPSPEILERIWAVLNPAEDEESGS